MPTSFTTIQVEHFKREAKKLSRSTGICHSHALDHVAEKQGYKNWSLLMKHSSQGLPEQFRFIRTSEEMRLAMLKGPQPRQWNVTRSDLVQERTADICNDFVTAGNAINFAADYMTCLLAVPRFRVSPATQVNVEMHCWLPYCVASMENEKQILVNRYYKPVGKKSREWATYEEYPHLHAHLTDEQLKMFSPRPQSLGFIFNDGCAPWHSRKDAEVYLGRLKVLQAILLHG